jgi:hypothetical protein
MPVPKPAPRIMQKTNAFQGSYAPLDHVVSPKRTLLHTCSVRLCGSQSGQLSPPPMNPPINAQAFDVAALYAMFSNIVSLQRLPLEDCYHASHRSADSKPLGSPPMNDDLLALLASLDPKARADLRRVLIRDQANRHAIASRLMRYRDQNGQDWADIIDFLTMHPEAPRGCPVAGGDRP